MRKIEQILEDIAKELKRANDLKSQELKTQTHMLGAIALNTNSTPYTETSPSLGAYPANTTMNKRINYSEMREKDS